MHRLFVGIRPPLAVREALIATMSGAQGARWQADEQLHITLRFIGEVDGRIAEDIDAALAGLRVSGFDLSLDGVGVFTRGSGHPTALWAGVRPHDSITALHRKIDRAIVRAGQPPERRTYLPHITIARIGNAGALVEPWLAMHAGLTSEPFAVTQLELFESHLGQRGARYETLARYPLG